MDRAAIDEVPAIVAELYQLVGRLETLFPGRHFTPDGHLVGSLGEVFAAFAFDLRLLPASAKSGDAIAPDGRIVEIKATQRSSVSLTADPTPMPDVLVALRLTPNGTAEVVYNGEASQAWDVAGKPQKTGQRPVSLSRLRSLDQMNPLPLVRPLA